MRKIKNTALILIVIYLVVNIILINCKYPSYNITKYSLGDEIILNDLCYKFTEFEIIEHDDFLERFPYVTVYDDEQINMLLTVNIENKTDSSHKLSLSTLILELGGWASNISIYTFFSLNKDITSSEFLVRPNEKIKLVLPYTYFILENEGICVKEFIEKKFVLNCYMDYPEKIVVEL